jgi:signal transduction histidine kinase
MEPGDEIRARLMSIPDPLELLEGIFAYAPVGFQIYTRDGHSVLTNQAFREMFGSAPPPEYNVLEDEIARASGVLDLIHRAFRGETIHTPPLWYDPRELKQVHIEVGKRVAMESTFFPLFARDGAIQYVAIVFKDVTAEHLAREHAEAQQRKAEEAERRARFLAEAGALLVGSLDHVAALKQVTRLLVPLLADYCLIDVVDGNQWSRVAAAHADPEKQPWLDELQRRYPARPGSPQPAARVIRSGQPLVLNDIEDPAEYAVDAEHLALLGKLGIGARLSVPLQVRGMTVGALSLCRERPRAGFVPADVELAGELGVRIASACELARLYRQAQEAIRARDEFLSIASHELKTPLTPLQLQIDMLQSSVQKGAAEPSLPKRIDQMHRQTLRLSRLVDSLLDVSRISVGQFTLERQTCDLGEIVTDVVERYADEARRALCEMRVTAAAPVSGSWDRMRLEQVVSNLISNALKYGAGHSVELTVDKVDQKGRLTVRDFGIGISAEDLSRIFERFERAVSTRQFGGLGLGLYIARQIVEAHGGSIAAESQLGAGSTFRMLLPADETSHDPN